MRSITGRGGMIALMTNGFDLDHFLALPRLSGLRLSPRGDRLVVAVQRPSLDGKKFASSLWEIDPSGARPPHRLTRSAPGESSAAFLRDGSIVFTSSRPDPDVKPDEAKEKEDVAALWLLPAAGGEARVIFAPPGGVDGVRAARDAAVVAFGVAFHRGVTSLEEDAAKEKARKDAGVGAILFEAYPIRFWDHYLGPRERHLFSGELPDDPEGRLTDSADLDPDGGAVYREVDFDLSPDGSTLVTGRQRQDEITNPSIDLVVIDRRSRERRALLQGDFWHEAVRISPDGTWAACIRSSNGSPDEAVRSRPWLVNLATGQDRPLSAGLDDVWPHELAWAPDSSAVFVAADRLGNVAVHRVEVGDGSVTLLAADGAYSELNPSPDGATLYALQSSLTSPRRPVRLDARAANQSPALLPFPGLSDAEIAATSVVERLTARAYDGTAIGSWLVRPADASASPSRRRSPSSFTAARSASWNAWHWRWNPHPLAARGYAVLHARPGDLARLWPGVIERGWGRWGEAPYTDVIAA